MCGRRKIMPRAYPGAVNLHRDQWHSFTGLRKDKINVSLLFTGLSSCRAAAAVQT